MKPLLFILAVFLLLSRFQLSVQAEIKTDEVLKQHFSFIKPVSSVKNDPATFLMLDGSKQNDASESKPTHRKPECFSVNKQFVNCLR